MVEGIRRDHRLNREFVRALTLGKQRRVHLVGREVPTCQLQFVMRTHGRAAVKATSVLPAYACLGVNTFVQRVRVLP